MCDKRLRILLVDDEASLREPLKKRLEARFGYEVDLAASGAEAIEHVETATDRHDVALIDQTLIPGPDGIEVMRHIKEIRPDIECIILTGWGSENRQQALEAGAYRYIEKPFDVDELAMLIRTAAQQVRQREISRAILGERDLELVLVRIAEAAQSLAAADEASIVLLNPDSDKLVINRREVEQLWSRHLSDRELTREITLSGAIAAIPDTLVMPNIDERFAAAGYLSLVGIPIPGPDGNLGVLYAYSRERNHFAAWGRTTVLQTLAGQAGLAIANAKAFKQASDHVGHMEALVKAAEALTKADTEIAQIECAWIFAHDVLRVSTFFIALYDAETSTLRFPLFVDKGEVGSQNDRRLTDDKGTWGLAGYVAKTNRELVWNSGDEKRQVCERCGIVPRQQGDPCQSCFSLPLRSGEHALGVLSIQSYEPHAFTPILLDICRALGTQLTVALEKTRLFAEVEADQARLKSFYRASNALTATQSPGAILLAIVQEAQKAAAARGVAMFLINEAGAYDLITHGVERVADPKSLIRDKGLSMTVMRTGQPEIIEDTLAARDRINRSLLEQKVGAALCLPVDLPGERLGVMWFYYNHPRSFRPSDVSAAQLYVNQAALAYDSARRLAALRRMSQADEALSGATTQAAVTAEVVEQARILLNGTSAHFWPYDDTADRFITESFASSEIPEALHEEFRALQPRAEGGASRLVIKQGLIVADTLEDPTKFPFLDEARVQLFKRAEIGSQLAIALKLPDETVGVLTINYAAPRAFSERELETARTFARHAALALKRARLLEQVSRVHDSATAVAQISALGDLRGTLIAIVGGLKQTLDCDAVTLFPYNAETDAFLFPPAVAGVRDVEAVLGCVHIEGRSVVRKILNSDKMHVAEDASSDSFIQGPFIEREGIRSTMGTVLRMRDSKVGVLFVNYRTSHTFTTEEIQSIELFANQAAVAIHNAQMYQAQQRHAQALHSIQETASQVSALLERDELLAKIVAMAANALDVPAATLMLWDERTDCFVVRALYGLSEAYIRQEIPSAKVLGAVDRARPNQPRYTRDLRESPYGRLDLIRLEDLCSALSVPVMESGQIIGILNLYSRSAPRLFTKDEEEIGGVFAAEIALALRDAHLYDATVKQEAALRALYRAGQITAVSQSQTLRETLDEIARQALVLVGSEGVQGSFSHLALTAGNRLRFTAASEPAVLERFRAQFGDIDLEGSGPIGVTGQVARTGEPFNIPHVQEYQAEGGSYIVLDQRTRSELAVPIRTGDRTIGVINVEHPARDAFKREDEIALSGLAAQAAIAIQNARLYEQQQIVADISRETARQLDLNAFLEALFAKLVDIFAGRDIPISPSLAVYDRASEQLTIYLSESFRNAGISAPVRSLNDKGIIPWVAKTRQPYYARVVTGDPHYLGLNANTCSECAVPILFGDDLLGVLDIESSVAYPFSPEDIQLLQTLADHIAATLNTIRQYTEIERTQDLVAARTAMAWIGMVSGVWGHSIGNKAVTVRDNVPLIRDELEKRSPNLAFIRDCLDKIAGATEHILEKPITPPLSSQEGVTSVRVNEFVRKRTERLWYNEPYKLTQLHPLDLELTEPATVRTSEEWLRQAFEIVIDNALDAMLGMSDRQLVIGTRRRAQCAEIYVTDQGHGIPPDALENLFRRPIDKPKGAKGMGIGLLFAKEIAQVYGGEIYVETTGPKGTTMVLALPLEQGL